MIKLITELQVTSNTYRFLKVAGSIFLGSFFGISWGMYKESLYKDVNSNNLTQYENEDQINQLIESSGKPAVIYYYLQAKRQHVMFRQYMLKYSSKYPSNCIWVMVNVKKKFQEVKPSMYLEYPNQLMLEARFPKSDILLKVGESGDKFIEANGHRREPYGFGFSEEGFKKFLEYNNIIEAYDPIQSTLKLTNSSLFNRANLASSA